MNAVGHDNPFYQALGHIAQRFPKPRAILCISAHWCTQGIEIQNSENPPLVYDFHGFPDELYQIHYPACGSPELATRVADLLAAQAPGMNTRRGYDHGAWAVLRALYPQADVPVVQLSLDCTQPATWHWHTAHKLRPLRDEGVLVLGSGNIVHNLRLADWRHIDTLGAGYDWAFLFRDFVNDAILNHRPEHLLDIAQTGQAGASAQAAQWVQAARLAVPTPEHYLPLLYVLAVRDPGETAMLFNDVLVGGSLSMTSVLVG